MFYTRVAEKPKYTKNVVSSFKSCLGIGKAGRDYKKGTTSRLTLRNSGNKGIKTLLQNELKIRYYNQHFDSLFVHRLAEKHILQLGHPQLV